MSVCPRPDKHPYPSRAIAMSVVKRKPKRKRLGLTAYRCACGAYHVGRRLRRPLVAWRSTP